MARKAKAVITYGVFIGGMYGAELAGEPTTNIIDAQSLLTSVKCGECGNDVAPCCYMAPVVFGSLDMWEEVR